MPVDPQDVLSILTDVQLRAGTVKCDRCETLTYRSLCLRIAVGEIWRGVLCPQCLKYFVMWMKRDPDAFESFTHTMTNPGQPKRHFDD